MNESLALKALAVGVMTAAVIGIISIEPRASVANALTAASGSVSLDANVSSGNLSNVQETTLQVPITTAGELVVVGVQSYDAADPQTNNILIMTLDGVDVNKSSNFVGSEQNLAVSQWYLENAPVGTTTLRIQFQGAVDSANISVNSFVGPKVSNTIENSGGSSFCSTLPTDLIGATTTAKANNLYVANMSSLAHDSTSFSIKNPMVQTYNFVVPGSLTSPSGMAYIVANSQGNSVKPTWTQSKAGNWCAAVGVYEIN